MLTAIIGVCLSVASSYQRQLLVADGHYAHVLVSCCFSALRHNVSIMQNQREHVASADQFLRSVLYVSHHECILLHCFLSASMYKSS